MNKYIALTFAALICSAPALALNAKRGGDVSSGGGDALVMAFTIGGQKACEYMRKTPTLKLPVSTEEFCAAVDGGVTVTSEDVTVLDGDEVDAINTPDLRKIVLSQKRNKPRDMEALKRLAVHEYLSVLRVDDTAFVHSGPIAAAITKESDYFPLRYCKSEYTLQAGADIPQRYSERALFRASFTTDFSSSRDEDLWLDFSGPLKFRLDRTTGKPVDVIQLLASQTFENQDTCVDLKDSWGAPRERFCLSYQGPKDILYDYLNDKTRPRTMLRMKASKLRSLETLNFINPNEQNSEAEFFHAKGYIDGMGFQGTHLYFSKQFHANDPGRTELKAWGAENIQVNCY